MSGACFVFPGQGSQYVGMGKSLYDSFQESRAVFDEASGAAGFDIAKLCFDGPESELNRTEFTQPAILTVSLAADAALKTRGIRPVAVAGHSLGELTAVCVAGGLTLAQAASLARKRGTYMQEAVPEGRGLMAAVLGLDADKIKEACAQASTLGVAAPANFNSPGQVVIAGEKEAVEKAAELCKAMGAKRVVHLAVSVPSHSPLMAPAATRLAEDLRAADIRDLDVPLAANAEGRLIRSADEVRRLLVMQLTLPLLWEDCVRALTGTGTSRIIEVGPGRVLSGLIKRINKESATHNVEDADSLESAVEQLKN
jgi:[acyl-carrier-protein] S-malonyltransferase